MSEIATNQNNNADIIALTVEKIKSELDSFHGGNKEKAVSKFVASTLTHFCEENHRFAEVVHQTKRTLSDCCEAVMKGCGSSISDIDVYRGAVKFYFPNSDIDFHMTIAINGDAPSEEEMAVQSKPKVEKKPKPKKPPEAKVQPKPSASVTPSTPTESKPAKKPCKEVVETIQLSLF